MYLKIFFVVNDLQPLVHWSGVRLVDYTLQLFRQLCMCAIDTIFSVCVLSELLLR